LKGNPPKLHETKHEAPPNAEVNLANPRYVMFDFGVIFVSVNFNLVAERL